MYERSMHESFLKILFEVLTLGKYAVNMSCMNKPNHKNTDQVFSEDLNTDEIICGFSQ